MKPVEMQNPDVILKGPSDMPECGDLHAVAEVYDERLWLTSVWKPTPEELAALNDGGSVVLSICAPRHPVVAVGTMDRTGEAVEG